MATVATASIMAVAKAAVGAAAVAIQAHGDGARRPGSPSDGCMVPISSDITMLHTTLTVHATAMARRVDCAKASESNELLLLSTTEPLLPAGPVPVHRRDGVHCRVTEYSGECRRIRVVTAMCRKCHERCRRHAAGWQRVAARRRRRGRPSEDFVRKLGPSVAPHGKGGREGARRVRRSSLTRLCGDRRVALYSTHSLNGAIATSWPRNPITMSDVGA